MSNPVPTDTIMSARSVPWISVLAAILPGPAFVQGGDVTTDPVTQAFVSDRKSQDIIMRGDTTWC